MKTAYSYIRWSGYRQTRGDSLRRQKQGSADLARRKGWRLDERIKADEGRSAYNGDNAATGHLAAFLRAIEEEEIERGSVLIVESLDRLTRQTVMEAFHLFQSILRAGVEIATINPERVYSWKSINEEPFALMEVLIVFLRANEESAMKSKRSKANWTNKRNQAKEKPMTKRVPQWCQVKEGKIIPIRERAKVVQMIFEYALEGMGAYVIARKLNEQGVKPWSAPWSITNVSMILTNRAVIGEFQSRTAGRLKSQRKPIGQPIPDYYPQIIPLETWYKVLGILRTRTRTFGRTGAGLNLFKGLIKDANDGRTFVLSRKGNGKHLTLVNAGACRGLADYIAFRYDLFEEAFLGFVEELKPLMIESKKKPKDDREEVKAVIRRNTEAIERIKKRMLAGEVGDETLDLLDQLEKARKSQQERLERMEAEVKTEPAHELKETQTLVALYKKARNPDDREKMKGKIRQLVRVIYMRVYAPSRYKRHAIVHVHFHSGQSRIIDIRTDTRNKQNTWTSMPVKKGGIWLPGEPGAPPV